MEGNEIRWQFNSSLSALVFMKTMTISTNNNKSIYNDPLFSCIITLYTLILLYFPQFVLSPVLILTSIILLSLLRLGANQKTQTLYQNTLLEDDGKLQQIDKWVASEPDSGSTFEMGFVPDQGFDARFVEWDVRAPLEVIYEEEQDDEDPTRIERYPSLSLYYPETDSDSDGSGEFEMGFPENWPENRWEEEEDNTNNREGLIEIALDGNYYNNIEKEIGFHFEDENLIEIDISQLKNNEFILD